MPFMKKSWWKVLSVALLIYTIIGGLLIDIPRRSITNETMRALYFHVPMWFAMTAMFIGSFVFAVIYLRKTNSKYDVLSMEFAHTGLAFGILGILTGMIWANYTWGSPWHGDVKQNCAAIATLIYLAYFVLRGSLTNDEQRARLSAVYSVFAFFPMIVLIFVLPRQFDSMHPGNGGNPGFNMYDLDNKMRMVFYPACVGWILLALWIATVRTRLKWAEEKILDLEYEKAK